MSEGGVAKHQWWIGGRSRGDSGWSWMNGVTCVWWMVKWTLCRCPCFPGTWPWTETLFFCLLIKAVKSTTRKIEIKRVPFSKSHHRPVFSLPTSMSLVLMSTGSFTVTRYNKTSTLTWCPKRPGTKTPVEPHATVLWRIHTGTSVRWKKNVYKDVTKESFFRSKLSRLLMWKVLWG